MGQVVMVVAAYLGLCALEMVPLVRQKNKKNIIVYLVFWATALVFSVLLVLNVEIPSFERFMIDLISSITGKGGI